MLFKIRIYYKLIKFYYNSIDKPDSTTLNQPRLDQTRLYQNIFDQIRLARYYIKLYWILIQIHEIIINSIRFEYNLYICKTYQISIHIGQIKLYYIRLRNIRLGWPIFYQVTTDSIRLDQIQSIQLRLDQARKYKPIR